MTCDLCQTAMEEVKLPKTIKGNGFRIVIEEMPTIRCPKCGDTYYDLEESEKIREVVSYFNRRLACLKKVA
ncbi:MAG: YgiT-type zinc finger protein [Candidatus Schekmanbacteria bacterium]|nr:YgiT-type zinc finger protein [Candidatus Schekmanbacteria bacterium]